MPSRYKRGATQLRRWAWRLAAGAILIIVFDLYLNPHFVVDMAGRFWSCI
jgi:hypothetical protein